MSEERLIKKYPNRRLYDTEESRYITLLEVKDLVMRGIAFKVVDSQGEQDITRSILLQIILEQEAAGQPLFTTDMLAQFIRFYGDTAQSAFTTFLGQGLDFFLKQQQTMAEQVKGLLTANPMDVWVKMGQSNMQFWNDMEAALSKETKSAAQDNKRKK